MKVAWGFGVRWLATAFISEAGFGPAQLRDRTAHDKLSWPWPAVAASHDRTKSGGKPPHSKTWLHVHE